MQTSVFNSDRMIVTSSLFYFLLSIALGIAVSILSFRLKLADSKGTIAVFILAVIIFYFGGFQWTIPIFTFYIFSSLLSKVRKKLNPEVDSLFQKSEIRDHYQVIANGGFPVILIMLNQLFTFELFYIAYVSAIAAVCADTWATEIGTMFNTKTYDIISFNLIEQGISGGVSILGIVGSFLAVLVISFSALTWLNDFDIVIIVILSGLAASIIDSVLGSTIQSKFVCNVCERIVERKTHCSIPATYTKGLKWLNNDGVNLATSIFGGLISLAIVNLIV